MFTDLFVHQTTHLISAMGVRFPGRVVGGGGLYLEYDDRDVPDVATVVADYDEGCQVIISATMCNDTQLGEIIRGHSATIKFGPARAGRLRLHEGLRRVRPGRRRRPGQAEGRLRQAGLHASRTPSKGNATYALWENFLECVRGRNRETLSTPELGAAAFIDGQHGRAELPLRQGAVLGQGAAQDRRTPTPAGRRNLEARSKKRGKPNQIIGWTGGDNGSTLTPPDYQKLEGPWVDGKDPAGA